jgi:hypothetical protein
MTSRKISSRLDYHYGNSKKTSQELGINYTIPENGLRQDSAYSTTGAFTTYGVKPQRYPNYRDEKLGNDVYGIPSSWVVKSLRKTNSVSTILGIPL